MFPTAPQPSLTNDQVVSYLLEWSNAGFQVFSEKFPNNVKGYSICFNSTDKITVRESEYKNRWIVQLGPDGRRFVNDVLDLDGLRVKVERVALETYNINFHDKPRTMSLTKGTPASNLVAIKSLIGNSTVLCIFDPFFDDIAIKHLIVLRNLGVKFSNDLRILTSAKIVNKKQISKIFVGEFFTEIDSKEGLIKFYNSSGHQGRYLILSNGQVVYTGCSLNELNTNERAHVDDGKGIQTQFDSIWNSSAPLPE